MIVRVRRKVDGLWHDAIYHCSRVMVDPKDETHVWVTMEGMQDGAVQMELDKATGLIFVMNDDGKTVDSYRWS